MVRESKKQSRAKAKQVSNEKTVGEGVKGKSQRGRSLFLLPLSPLPCPIVFSFDHLLYETRTKSHPKIRCEKGVNPFSNWTKILTNGKTFVWFSASVRILGLVRAPRLDFNRSLGSCLVLPGEARAHLPNSGW